MNRAYEHHEGGSEQRWVDLVYCAQQAAVGSPDQQSAIDELYRRFHFSVLKACFAILKDADLAEDAAQNTWMNVFRFIPNLENEGAFKKWLIKIAINCAYDVGRKQKKWPRQKPADFFDNLQDADGSPVVAAATHETCNAFHDALIICDTDQQMVVQGRLKGLSLPQIAEQQGSTYPLICRHNDHARCALADVWEKHCNTNFLLS